MSTFPSISDLLKKTSFTRRIYIFFSIIFLFVLIIGIITFKNNERFHSSSISIEQTNELLNEAEEILSRSQDLSVGIRGYVATGDTSYLENFNAAKKLVFHHTYRLKRLTSTNPLQQARVDSLTTLIQKRIVFSSLLIRLKDQKLERQVNELLETKQSKIYMDGIRNLIAEIKADAKNTLQQQKQNHDNSLATTGFAFLMLSIILVILLVISFAFIRYNSIRRANAEVKIKENVNLFSMLFYESPVMKAIADAPTGKYLEVNQAFAEFWGYTKEEMIGKSSIDLRILVQAEERDHILKKMMTEGFVRNVETQTNSKDGRIRWVSTNIDRINLNGKDCFLTAAIDITARKEAEEKIRQMNLNLEKKVEEKTREVIENEKRFRAITENSTDMIALIDGNFKPFYRSPSSTRITGWTDEDRNDPEETLELTHPEDSALLKNKMQELMANPGQPIAVSFRTKHKNGTYIWMEGVITNMLDDESLKAIVSNLRDVTEKKNTEDELKNIFERISDAFIALDKNWCYTYLNKKASILHGKNAEDLIGKEIWTEFPEVRNEPLFDALHKAMESQKPQRLQLYYSRTNKWYEDFIYPSLEGVSVYYRDITETKKADEILKQSHRQLRQLAAHLQSIREEERARIAREIHDELGQQLTRLKMDVSSVEKKLQGSDSGIQEKIWDMHLILDETVKIVRRISTELRPGILDDLGLIAAMEWQCQEFEKRTGIACKLISSFVEENFDKSVATGLFRIFQETLTNIARHSGATKVESVFSRNEEHMSLFIEDNGNGFDSELTKSKMTLGIVGMKERAWGMQGELEVQSSPGKGTRIVVKIPL